MLETPNAWQVFGISLVTSLIILCISSYLIYYLHVKSNQHPYSHISSFWVMVSLGSVICNQITFTIFINFSKSSLFAMYQLIHMFIFNNIKTLCLIMRSIAMTQAFNYNHYHLSRRFHNHNFHIEDDKAFKNVFFTRRFHKYKLFFFILILLLFYCLLCLSFEDLRNGIIVHLSTIYHDIEKIDFIDKENNAFLAFILVNIPSYALFLLYSYYMICLYKHNLQYDSFKIKHEITGSFILIFLGYNLPYILHFILNIIGLKDANDTTSLFAFESGANIGLIFIIGTLTIIRYDTFKQYSSDYLYANYNNFMKNYISFKIFKDYIQLRHWENYPHFNFWINYWQFMESVDEYKKQVDSIDAILPKNNLSTSDHHSITITEKYKTSISSAEEKVKSIASQIFKDYFMVNSMTNDTRTNELFIEFPGDIYEKAEEQNQTNFSVDNYALVFEDAYKWIDQKILKLFNTFKNDEEEKAKMDKILFCLNCFEVMKE